VDLQLAPEVQEERPVRHLAHTHAGQCLERGGDLRGVRLTARVAGDVDDQRRAGALNHVECGDDTADTADGHGQVARGAGGGGYLDPRGDGVSGSGNWHVCTLLLTLPAP
jgi:hypothetical protein